MSRQKVILLKSAWKRGLRAFARQAIISARDTFWSQKFLIFRMEAKNNNLPDMPDIPGLTFRRILRWEELAPKTINFLQAAKESLGWGEFEWLTKRGYGLWIAEIHGDLAALKWWRHNNQCDGYNEVIHKNTELHWQTTVLPKYRGLRILERIMFSVMQYRSKYDVEFFIAQSRDYNSTSIRMFNKMKWEYIGYLKKNKITGIYKWYLN